MRYSFLYMTKGQAYLMGFIPPQSVTSSTGVDRGALPNQKRPMIENDSIRVLSDRSPPKLHSKCELTDDPAPNV